MSTESQYGSKSKLKPTKIEVNGRIVTAADDHQTVAQIMALDGKRPETYYLVELKGKHEQVPHRDPMETLKLHEGDRFITVSIGPTPVS